MKLLIAVAGIVTAVAIGLWLATGFHPYVIQTVEQREAIGNPGELRVVNMHGMMAGL